MGRSIYSVFFSLQTDLSGWSVVGNLVASVWLSTVSTHANLFTSDKAK